MHKVGRDRFERLVVQALNEIPPGLRRYVDNLVVEVDDIGSHPALLGLYEGHPLTERDDYGNGELPDRIYIYRWPICAVCDEEREIVHEVTKTVIHEVAHHFGIDDERLFELGWD